MHYFQFNIGDYKSHTNHLDLLEDLAYRRLLDLYYLHERPLNGGTTSVARQIGMRDNELQVQSVLEEFFELTEDGWTNCRADREIQHYKGKVDQASRAGKASAERRLYGRSTGVQPNNNQEPITNNHKTTNNINITPEGVSPSVWQDYKNLRKAKKAPITQRVIDGMQQQADIAGWTLEQAMSECCVRGWQAFKAEWVAEKQSYAQQAFDVARTTVPSSSERDPALAKLDEDRKNAKPNPEILAKIREALKGKVA